MRGLYYGYAQEFLNTKNVAELHYIPSYSTNHMFKEDFLLITYEPSSSPKDRHVMYGVFYDELVWGYNIPNFLVLAEHYSGYDASKIWAEIEEKRRWLLQTYPDAYAHEVGNLLGDQTFSQWAHDTYKHELI